MEKRGIPFFLCIFLLWTGGGVFAEALTPSMQSIDIRAYNRQTSLLSEDIWDGYPGLFWSQEGGPFSTYLLLPEDLDPPSCTITLEEYLSINGLGYEDVGMYPVRGISFDEALARKILDSPDWNMDEEKDTGDSLLSEKEDEIRYDIPVEINHRVEAFIRYFQTKGRRHFTRWLQRSQKYLPMIKRIFREYGLPEDLAYLALIESGFNPNARSRANAVGIWQFMKATARKYGLRINWWIDERKDPEKATRAAALYLRDLYDMFGSWYLAVAGYNAGEGRIKRAVRKHKSQDFWTLARFKRTLKKETRNYIPKYIAAMLIAKDPETYGFEKPEDTGPLLYDKVRIPYATDIKVIAMASGTTVREIKRLNPELLRWFTPPDYPEYEIKIPPGTKEVFVENMKKVPPPERLRFHTHRVRRGDTLWSIARRYRASIKEIMYLNNIRSPRRIRAGSRLVVPVRAEKKSRSKKRRYTYAQIPSRGTYTVKRGDTLWDISTRFGIPLEYLMEINGLREGDLLYPGQKLILQERAM